MTVYNASTKNWKEESIKKLLFLCAFLSILTTLGIIWILGSESFEFFKEISFSDFFGSEWSPLIQPQSFGVFPLVCGTLHIVVISSFFAIPVGLLSAIYLSEYASNRSRAMIKPTLEVLAGIPTIVYGYFALTFVTPLLQKIFPSMSVYNSLSASLVVGIMILPMVCSLCDDALRAVPSGLRQAGYAMGSTSTEVSLKITIPAALSGIVASFVLAFSRAIGETMIVALAAGSLPNLTTNPLESIQTMTAFIVETGKGDVAVGTVEYNSIFVVAGLLFLITLVINLIANLLLKKYREVYE